MTRRLRQLGWPALACTCPGDDADSKPARCSLLRHRVQTCATYSATHGRRGTVLIVTIWVLLALAGLVLALAWAMRVEGGCSANEAAELQADAIEQGAIQYVLAHVDSLNGQVPSDTDMPCDGVRLGEGAFWIIRPNFDDDRAFAFGLVDEASKVNLNTAPMSMLSMLPGVTSEIAASIVDWRDSDDSITPGGAESAYYLLCNDPYQCKNAPLETVEELLLVKDMTSLILYGEDANRNGALDGNEDDADASEPPDNRDGRLDRGLAPFVTVYSSEPNTTSSGGQRSNVNDRSQALTDLLTKNVSAGKLPVVLDRIRLGRPFRSILEFYVRSGLTASEFDAIADSVTTRSGTSVSGLINVNTAPREVLACLPGLEDSDVAALLAKRSGATTPVAGTAGAAPASSGITWVAEALRPQKAVAIGNYITGRSYQFSADIVSVAGNGRAFRRCRLVVDARTSPPKVIYRQNLTRYGWPLAEEVLTDLRAGRNPDEVIAAAKTLNASTR